MLCCQDFFYKKYISYAKGLDPAGLDVPVVGGHAGATILPLLSQTNPPPEGGFTDEELHRLTDRIQNGGTEVVEAKAGIGGRGLGRVVLGTRGAWGGLGDGMHKACVTSRTRAVDNHSPERVCYGCVKGLVGFQPLEKPSQNDSVRLVTGEERLDVFYLSGFRSTGRFIKEKEKKKTARYFEAGAGSATLSMAAAAAQFADSCLRAMSGEQGVVECAYVASAVTDLPFFASKVGLAPSHLPPFSSPGRPTSLTMLCMRICHGRPILSRRAACLRYPEWWITSLTRRF